MESMFCYCKLPFGFVTGSKFVTEHVTNLANMFDHCKLPEGETIESLLNNCK